MNTIVHITTRADWQAAQQAGEYRHSSLTTDGYIHCSLPSEDQLLAVANAHFTGQADLVVLVIDPLLLTAPVKAEESQGSGVFFPHVYGPVNLAAIIQVLDFSPQANGRFCLPTALADTRDTAQQENFSFPRTLSS